MRIKVFTLAIAATAMAATMLAPSAAAAHPRHHGERYRVGDYYHGADFYRSGDYYRGGDYYRDSYHPRERSRHARHRGYRCDPGNGGMVIGAIAGGLLGNEIAKGGRHRGDGTTGTIVGAGLGALIGRAADRSC